MFKTIQYPKILAIYIFLLAIPWSLYAYSRGVVMSPDSGRYSLWADTLLKHNFNILKFSEHVDFVVPPIFYYNWVAVMAFSKVFLGENWGIGIVVLNLVVGIFIATILFKTTWVTTGKLSCAIFAGLLLLLCHDFLLWIPFVLSDTLFSSLCFSIFILIINLYQQPAEHLNKVVGIGILLGIILFFRPSWPPLLIFVILSIPLIFFFSLKADDPSKRQNFIIRFTLLACVFIPAIIFLHSYIMLHPDKWPFPFLDRTISFVALDYQQGIVIAARPETHHSPSNNILAYAFITLHKLVAFFYINVDGYSFKHALLNYIFFLPVYGLSILATVKLFKKDNGPSPENWWRIFSCLLFIFLFAFFHALEQIDFDFRYRLPCILPLILLASLGLNELINDFFQKNLT